MKKFVDDKIEALREDILRIQKKPGMYISYLGQRGAAHLAKEIINNMIDECINTNSPGNRIDIFLDEVENSLTVSDNGRGIPFDDMETICTISHSGSKFTREGSGGNSAGENGIGTTAVNALSSNFEIMVTRYGQRKTIKFEYGRKSDEAIKTLKDDKNHGTTFKFIPSPKYLGECKLPTDLIMEWVDKISYLLPKDLLIVFTVNKVGKESTQRKKFSNTDGLHAYVKRLSKKLTIEPVQVFRSMTIKEIVEDTEDVKGGTKEIERFIGIEAAFSYNSSGVEVVADSFCNFINTVENGIHVDAVKNAIVQYLTKRTKDSLTEREAKKLDIINSDATNGLVMSVCLNTDMQPHFASQTKEKLTNQALFQPIRNMMYSSLNDYFKNDPKLLKKYTDIIKQNAKIRAAANEAKNSVIKGEVSTLDLHKLENFDPANNKGKAYKEIYIIEGGSAKGSAKIGRFRDTQALFAIKGVPTNTYDMSLARVLNSEEFKQFITILGCNTGSKFDITKCKYNKIIILTDADVDGYRIASLLCAFFVVHLPGIVEAGMLYKAVTPLYKIKNTKKPFIISKREYIDVFEEVVRKSIRIAGPDKKIFNNDLMKSFLLQNRDYLEELDRIAKHFAIKPLLLETLLIHRDDKDFNVIMKNKYPEITIDSDGYLSGIHEGEYQILIMDKIYKKKIKTLIHYIDIVNGKQMYLNVFDVNGKGSVINDRGIMSIGELMMLIQKYQPEILMRYKGLGELQPQELRDTTLDPANRTLIQLSTDDIKKELETFRILHGEKGKAELKKLMTNVKISREDLDN